MQAPSDSWYSTVGLSLATPESLPTIIDAAIAARIIALDAETRPRPGTAYSGLDVRPYNGALEATRSRLAGVCIAVDQDHGYYVPCQHDEGNLDPVLIQREFRRLGAAISCGVVTVCFWNAPFDQAVLAKALGVVGAWPEGSFIDGAILDRVLRPHSFRHDLKSAVASTLKLKMLEFEAPRREAWVPELADHPLFEPRDNMSLDIGARAPVDVARYGAGDAVCTLRYCLAAAAKSVKDDTARLIAVEHAFVAPVRSLPRNQIGYDRAQVLRLADEYVAVRAFCADVLRGLGVTNPSSPKQIAELLARHGYRGEGTDKKQLKRIPHAQEELRAVAALVREYRLADKYITSYLAPIVNADHPSELCGSWSASGAKSGRMSAGPAKGKKRGDQHVWATWLAHGIPKQKAFRSIFVARPGRVLIKADFASQEYRVCAVLANARSWIDVFNGRDPDVHALTARKVFPQYDLVSEAARAELRGVGKTLNFSIIYGSGVEGVASLLECSVERAQLVLDSFYGAEPALRKFQEESQAQAKQYGRVYTHYGRPIAVRAQDTVDDDDTTVHAAPNYRIQGTCGDILKLAVNDFFAREAQHIEIMGGDDTVRVVNLVHDEVLLEVVKHNAERVADVLRGCMEGAAPAAWPLRLPVEVHIGESWSA